MIRTEDSTLVTKEVADKVKNSEVWKQIFQIGECMFTLLWLILMYSPFKDIINDIILRIVFKRMERKLVI